MRTPKTSCIMGTSVHKQFCNRKLGYFALAFRARKRFGTFEKRVPARSSIGFRSGFSLYLDTVKFTICGKLNRVPESRVAEKISE